MNLNICSRPKKQTTLLGQRIGTGKGSVLFLLCFHARLFVDALWAPAGKGLTSWLSFVMSDSDVVTFSLVSWVRCGA